MTNKEMFDELAKISLQIAALIGKLSLDDEPKGAKYLHFVKCDTTDNKQQEKINEQ